MNLFHSIDHLLGRGAQQLVRLYQHTLSPDKGLPSLRLKGRICMHEPHCSQYAIHTLRRYGFIRSIGKIMDRVSQCTGGTEKIYDPAHYRVVFFSSAPIGVPFLEKLQENDRFEIAGVVTTPDKPAGRGMKIQENIIKQTAKNISNNNDFIQTPNSLRLDSKKYADEAQEFYTWLQHKQPDFIVVIAYGKIIPSHILDLPNIGPINVHGSLLPRYRGASPIQSVFLHHENKTGITIMEMAPTLDTGNMIDKLSFPIQRDRTAKDVVTEMQIGGPKFLVDTLRKYGKGMLGKVTQNDAQATYCSKISKEDGEINPYEDPITDIYAKYRAFALRPKIYFFDNNKRFIIEKLVIDQQHYEHHKNQPLIANHTLNAAVTDILLKPEGKKSMTRESFVKRNHT